MLDEKHRHLLARHVNALGQDARQRLSLARSVAVASDATVDDVDRVGVFD
jgi:ABC-type phosphate transport system ATPase subunit